MTAFAGVKLRLTAVRRSFVEQRAASASPPRCSRKSVEAAVIQINASPTEFVDRHGLFASLVLHQVRPHNRSPVADPEQCSHSSHEVNSEPLSVAVPNIAWPLALGSAKRVKIAGNAASHPSPAPIEKLFSELAHRRLRKLAIGGPLR
jgi:hypothetical protein